MTSQTYPITEFSITYCSMSVASMQVQFMRSVVEEKWNRSSFSSEYNSVINSSMPIHQCNKNTVPEE
jgi:hypothetical protein